MKKAEMTCGDAIVMLAKRGIACDSVGSAIQTAMDAKFANKAKGWKKPNEVKCHAADPNNCRFHKTGKYADVSNNNLFNPLAGCDYDAGDIQAFLSEQMEAAGLDMGPVVVEFDNEICAYTVKFQPNGGSDAVEKAQGIVDDFVFDINGTGLGDTWDDPKAWKKYGGVVSSFTTPESEDMLEKKEAEEEGGGDDAAKGALEIDVIGAGGEQAVAEAPGGEEEKPSQEEQGGQEQALPDDGFEFEDDDVEAVKLTPDEQELLEKIMDNASADKYALHYEGDGEFTVESGEDGGKKMSVKDIVETICVNNSDKFNDLFGGFTGIEKAQFDTLCAKAGIEVSVPAASGAGAGEADESGEKAPESAGAPAGGAASGGASGAAGTGAGGKTPSQPKEEGAKDVAALCAWAQGKGDEAEEAAEEAASLQEDIAHLEKQVKAAKSAKQKKKYQEKLDAAKEELAEVHEGLKKLYDKNQGAKLDEADGVYKQSVEMSNHLFNKLGIHGNTTLSHGLWEALEGDKDNEHGIYVGGILEELLAGEGKGDFQAGTADAVKKESGLTDMFAALQAAEKAYVGASLDHAALKSKSADAEAILDAANKLKAATNDLWDAYHGCLDAGDTCKKLATKKLAAAKAEKEFSISPEKFAQWSDMLDASGVGHLTVADIGPGGKDVYKLTKNKDGGIDIKKESGSAALPSGKKSASDFAKEVIGKVNPCTVAHSNWYHDNGGKVVEQVMKKTGAPYEYASEAVKKAVSELPAGAITENEGKYEIGKDYKIDFEMKAAAYGEKLVQKLEEEADAAGAAGSGGASGTVTPSKAGGSGYSHAAATKQEKASKAVANLEAKIAGAKDPDMKAVYEKMLAKLKEHHGI